MAILADLLPRQQRLQLAVRTKGPSQVARTLAGCVGQCYDRDPFDAVAREIYALYASESVAAAGSFRHQLDRRLCERSHPAVDWDGRRA